ncbi:mitochondrial Ubox domain-containing protein [Andalucia godoyi]|uniref:RING-type E3 ubiquitin transferase n=1 Tax=Andalucia godoyi TaxID=505711 RepID=A0A8K0AGE5_ANDGO|nr:mitochondrial Ubox domain-containing protein [Andalucia godoyi]|eukprot:ANDGO_05924.mRNA.1 mitochondrial Ubox domain-containing protein
MMFSSRLALRSAAVLGTAGIVSSYSEAQDASSSSTMTTTTAATLPTSTLFARTSHRAADEAARLPDILANLKSKYYTAHLSELHSLQRLNVLVVNGSPNNAAAVGEVLSTLWGVSARSSSHPTTATAYSSFSLSGSAEIGSNESGDSEGRAVRTIQSKRLSSPYNIVVTVPVTTWTADTLEETSIIIEGATRWSEPPEERWRITRWLTGSRYARTTSAWEQQPQMIIVVNDPSDDGVSLHRKYLDGKAAEQPGETIGDVLRKVLRAAESAKIPLFVLDVEGGNVPNVAEASRSIQNVVRAHVHAHFVQEDQKKHYNRGFKDGAKDAGIVARRAAANEILASEGACCPLTGSAMNDPVISPLTGISYERSAITKHLSERGTDPAAGQMMRPNELIPNYALSKVLWFVRQFRQ